MIFDLFRKKKNIPIEIDFHKKWVIVAEKGINNYETLTDSERIWFNIRGLIDSTNNGGLISYYYNSGAENVYDTIDDLKKLDFDNIVSIIERFNRTLFKESKVPREIERRNEFINVIDENTEIELQKLEEEISKLIDNLEKQLNIYLKKEKLIE